MLQFLGQFSSKSSEKPTKNRHEIRAISVSIRAGYFGAKRLSDKGEKGIRQGI
jgi:hypothetical protein